MQERSFELCFVKDAKALRYLIKRHLPNEARQVALNRPQAEDISSRHHAAFLLHVIEDTSQKRGRWQAPIKIRQIGEHNQMFLRPADGHIDKPCSNVFRRQALHKLTKRPRPAMALRNVE